MVESGVNKMAASCGTLANVGRDSTPTVGETTLAMLAMLADPGGD